MRNLFLVLGLLLLPFGTHARTYEVGELPYSDNPTDRETAIALTILTDEGIVEGYPDGSFRADRLLNRAEFTKIAMGYASQELKDMEVTDLNCFPDVEETDWFADPVCRAKQVGIVRGNVREEVPPEEWLFIPNRAVQYVEALKILTEMFELETREQSEGDEWYDVYLDTAYDHQLELNEASKPDHLLTRGQMVKLVVRFAVFADGELPTYLDAIEGLVSEESAEDTDTSNEDDSPDVGTGSVKTGTGGVTTGTGTYTGTGSSVVEIYDEDPDDRVRSNFILLDDVSPVLGAAEVFSEAQPLDITSIIVRLDSEVTSFESLLVYDHNAKLLGSAYVDTNFPGNRQYLLPVQNGSLIIEKETEFTFYVRGVTKAFDEGGVSGEIVRIETMGVEGNGVWNSKTQSEFSTDTFLTFQTARSIITDIDNPGGQTDILIAGSQLRLGSFRFKGIAGESGADLLVTDLTINVDQTGGITLDNVRLSADGVTDRMDCSVLGSTITCSDIAAQYGSFEDIPRILTLYGDVIIPGGTSDASLRLTLNDPGTPSGPGAVTWTDGDTEFKWVPGDFPIVYSTTFEL